MFDETDRSRDIRHLVRLMDKPPDEWQRADLVRFCLEQDIKVVNFRYPALDGKLRELRLPVNDPSYLDRVLAAGERVDGSSLFPKLFRTSKSDLYVIPVYRWAYINPWASDELDVVCRFADGDGQPCADTPDNLLHKAAEQFGERTGAELQALAELEFYLFTRPEHRRFTSRVQRNYHQAAPYLHSRDVADEILRVVSEVTGCVKYCHTEVGYMDRIQSDEPEIDGCRVEQYELCCIRPDQGHRALEKCGRTKDGAIAGHHALRQLRAVGKKAPGMQEHGQTVASRQVTELRIGFRWKLANGRLQRAIIAGAARCGNHLYLVGDAFRQL